MLNNRKVSVGADGKRQKKQKQRCLRIMNGAFYFEKWADVNVFVPLIFAVSKRVTGEDGRCFQELRGRQRKQGSGSSFSRRSSSLWILLLMPGAFIGDGAQLNESPESCRVTGSRGRSIGCLFRYLGTSVRTAASVQRDIRDQHLTGSLVGFEWRGVTAHTIFRIFLRIKQDFIW